MKPKYQFLGIGHHHHHLHDHHQHHHHHHHHAISGSGREVESECREDGSWSQVKIFLIVLVIALLSILKYGEDQICHHIALTILKDMDFMVSSFFSLQVQLSCHGLGEAPLVSEHQPPNPLALILQFFLP